MELWLVRHPEPEVRPGICYGRLDLAVSKAAIASSLQKLCLPAFDRLRSSPALRCRLLAERLHAAPIEDVALQERHFGEWEGVSWEAIDRSALDAWAADPWDFAPPGGESARMLRERVRAAVAVDVALGGVAVWVTHQGVIRATAGLLLNLPDKEWMTLQVGFGEAIVYKT
ncbi:MAG: histidine phosphatase family protein [Rhodocyclaceae bacterium]|nr:histidine phosphatase family protein [Rhodocyclaceae bacterium]